MSYDFALQKLCSHEIRMESGIYNSSFGVVRFKSPPSNQRVTVWVDGVEVPRAGLWSNAFLIFSNPGPYRIKRDQNDLLYVRLGNDLPRFVPLITGVVRPSDMVKDLSKKIPSLNFEVNKERVVVSSKTPVKDSAFAFYDPRHTDKTQSLSTTARVLGAYSSLGIIPGRVATGRMIFPSWTIEPDPVSAWEMDKVVKFSKILPNKQPTIHLSYVTHPTYCRRCGGSRIEFDYNIVGNSYETIDGVDLLAQEFDKFLFTRIGSHWKWTWLGSKLIDRIGAKGTTGRAVVSSMLSLDVSQAFSVYQNIKMQQSRNSPAQQVSDAEYPHAIKNVSVNTLPEDPTVAVVSITIMCRSSEPVMLKRIVGSPNQYTIGSNIGLATTPDFLLRG